MDVRVKSVFKRALRINGKNLAMPLIPFVIVEFLFLFIVQYKHEFHLNSPILWEALLEKLVVDISMYWGGTMLLFAVTRTKIISFVFASFYLLVTLTDSAIYLFGNTLLEKHHLDLISWYSIGGFLSPLLFVILFVLVLSFYLTWKTITPLTNEPLLYPIAVLAALGSLFYFGHFNERMIKRSEWHPQRFKDESDKHQHFLLRCHNDEIRYVRQNSFIHFIREVAKPVKKERYKVVHSLKPFEKTIKKWNLPLGERHYQSLHLKQFKHIILFTNESLSLDLLAGYNHNIPAENASFLDAPEQRNKTFDNYYTTASPTLHGLAATLNSHPNYHAILDGRHFANSLPNILKKAGYRTIFLRGASKFYAKENIIFKNFGYEQVIAREFFEKQEKYDPFIFEWGVSDRIVFQKLVSLLRKHKNDKVFITILGINTHPPNGRDDSKRIGDFPEFPREINKLGRPRKFLKAVQQLDFNLRWVLNKIKEEGLYNEDTLVIITADHACPYNSVTRYLKGFPTHNLGRIPLLFLTPAHLPPIRRHILSSQLDLAPTILHLLDIKIPDGYWGDSLFSRRKRAQKIGFDRGRIFYKNGTVEKQMRHRGNSGFMKLFNVIKYQ